MCGIAGIVSNNPGLVSKQRLQKATGTLIHRGPEAEGFYSNTSQTAALGHRRLCIIDLSEAAAQPLSYLGRYHLVHNGEIYNYVELREDLKKKGYAFQSESDTEVIAAAFAAYGKDCLQHFDGMFAFAIWDDQEQELFAARDRFGEKPFFFYFDGEQLAFASEMKALWSMGIERQVNKSLLYNFLSIDYTANPADPQETFFENIYKLPAASFLTYSLTNQQAAIEKYWQLYPEVNSTLSEEEAVEQFSRLFSASIKNRLRSDVAIGTSLSGGLDSSAIVAFCDEPTAAHYTHKCFTASFKGFERDELQFAQRVAHQFNLEHHVAELSAPDVVALMQQVMAAQEEPIASASPLAQYKTYELAKKNGVTVLLDGQGADEVLAGYHKYYKWYWLELYRNRRLSQSQEVKAAQALGVKESFGLTQKLAALFPELAAGLLQSSKARRAFKHPDLNRDFAFTHKRHLNYSTPPGFDLNSALYFNTFVYGLEELLRMADRNSMAHSLEVRLPFLNHQLVAFLFTLPPHFKIHQGWTKWLLRRAAASRLPNEIVWRKDKTGFEPPQRQWMRDQRVQEAIQQAKEVLVKNDILDASVLEKKNQPHDAHVADNRVWKYWSAAYLFNHTD
jgi:asparagine synthase (glutamine-hydrolysing)